MTSLHEMGFALVRHVEEEVKTVRTVDRDELFPNEIKNHQAVECVFES